MNELIRQLIARDLTDFEGMELRGSIPVRTELVNQLIAVFLNEPESESASVVSVPENGEPAAKVSLPMPLLKRMVRRAAVRAEEGRIILDFEIRR